jgi:hypothetical protein
LFPLFATGVLILVATCHWYQQH